MRTLRDTLLAAVAALVDVPQSDHIKVWRFVNAPEGLKALSQAGGDEDWLALVPDDVGQRYHIPWLWGGGFGRCSVDEYIIAGATVYIGTHA